MLAKRWRNLYSPFSRRKIYTSFYANSKFAKVEASPNFPKEEEKVLAYWDEIKAFKKQLELTKDLPPWTFFDGPPFATGLPHYGHLAVGAIKDTIWRYATQNGHYVERRFGWDCHGLPIEYEIDKLLDLKTKQDYDKIGVKAYNDHWRAIVMKYSTQWETIVNRFGRWIDFKNDYKTMDLNYMESVWYVFKQMYDKGLVYKSSRVMPYSTKWSTVLSNFEAGSNYKQVNDPSILITFPLVNESDTWMLAWTTTPWTLPSNLWLAVNPEMTYIKFLHPDDKKSYIILESRKKEIFKMLKLKNPTIISSIKGSSLEGKKYIPLFDYFGNMAEQGCFQIIAEQFVTDNEGTGVVHCAPGFGEDDFNACVRRGIIDPSNPVCPIDESGRFTKDVDNYEGMYFKDADANIKKELKEKGRKFKKYKCI
jgi:isoleucyl-tRNA synthetase